MKTAVKKEDQSILLSNAIENKPSRSAWNKGKLLGQKPPLKLKATETQGSVGNPHPVATFP